ncbi:MAG: gamma-glutamyltransferase, partial [Rhodospirillaceae bacterium]
MTMTDQTSRRMILRIGKTLLVGAGLLFWAPTSAQAQEAVQPEQTYAVAASAPEATGSEFMVTAAHPLAVQAGYDVLAAGGTAVDAMVAVQIMLNLVEPQSSGIGGGGFALYWDAASQTLTSFDGRETAPAAADEGYWLGEDGEPVGFWDAVIGGRSVGVPGTVRLLHEMHGRYGSQPWADLLQPTISLAEEGFAISPRMAASIASAQERGLDRFPETKAYFFKADATPRAEGEILRNPAFAETLAQIAQDGPTAFYAGPIAEALIAATRTEINPGVLTMADLAAYQVIERPPVCIAYRGYDVCGMGPPSSGGLTVGQILGLLRHAGMPGLGNGPEAAHWFSEAAKLAYADRGLYMADRDFVRMPTEGLLDATYLAIRAQAIQPGQAMEKASPGNPPWDEAQLFAPDTQTELPGTSHMSIVDGQGNVLSFTTTIETGFGSRVMSGGFLLNNEMTDFSRAPRANGRPIANRVEAGKRPRSSMAPTIVLKDGKPVLAIGSPGGSRIINYVARATIGILDWGLSPGQALAMGHVVNRNGATDLEAGSEAEALAPALEALGHSVTVRDLNSGLHAVQIGADGT